MITTTSELGHIIAPFIHDVEDVFVRCTSGITISNIVGQESSDGILGTEFPAVVIGFVIIFVREFVIRTAPLCCLIQAVIMTIVKTSVKTIVPTLVIPVLLGIVISLTSLTSVI